MADYGRRVAYVFYNPKVALFLSTFLYVPRIVLFVILKPSDLDSVLLLLVSTSALNAFIIIVYTWIEKVRSSLSFEKNLLLQHISFSRNIFYSAPIGWSVAYSPTLVLGFFSGPVLVGVLGTLRSIVGLANFFVEMIEVSVISHLASRKHKGEEQYVQKFFRSLIILFSICWLVLLAASIELYDFGIAFVDDEFKQYRNIFLLLCVSYIVYFYGRMHVLYFRVFYDTKPEFYNSRVALVATVLLFPLIYAFDIVGAAVVFILSQAFALTFTVKKFGLKVQS
jgi:O-antigen/teichoic acid export membrane protein